MRLIRRSQWGAREPRCRTALPIERTRGIAVHYSGTGADEGMDGARVMRAHQNFHMSPGWDGIPEGGCDIAYNLEFNNRGEIYEGRGWGVRSASQGSNEGNSYYYGACFQGTDKAGRDDVKPAGRKALRDIIREYKRLAGRWPEVRPHSFFHGTQCPGAELRAYIALKGWLQDTGRIPWPRYFFDWAAWRLGEGRYAPYGKANPRYRPLNPRKPVAPMYWAYLRLFLQRRNKG